MSGEAAIIIKDDDTVEIVPGNMAVVIQETGGAALVPGVEMLVISDRGPPGPPGAGDFTFVQTTPLTTWTVNHNKGLKPLVSVRNAGGYEVDATVVHLSDFQLQVLFDSPQAGSVRCI
jgi:hypothetical protein